MSPRKSERHLFKIRVAIGVVRYLFPLLGGVRSTNLALANLSNHKSGVLNFNAHVSVKLITSAHGDLTRFGMCRIVPHSALKMSSHVKSGGINGALPVVSRGLADAALPSPADLPPLARPLLSGACGGGVSDLESLSELLIGISGVLDLLWAVIAAFCESFVGCNCRHFHLSPQVHSQI